MEIRTELESGDFDERLPAMIFQVREDLYLNAYKKTELYERTLGLAVIPVLLRRLIIVTARKIGLTRESIPFLRKK